MTHSTTKILFGTLFIAAALAAGNSVATSNSDTEENAKETVDSSSKDRKAKASKVKDYDNLLQTKVQRGAKIASYDIIPLQREGYISAYCPENRIPLWVAWNLTKQHTDGPYKREGNKFTADTDVPAPRAEHQDYVNSGYDRGHMCPSADCRWSQNAQEQSFLLTNICPQLHNLNGGDWKELEDRCRTWALQYGSIYIVCGPLLMNKKHKTIGKNKVVVPEAFFKVVLRLGDQPAAIGFIYRNERTNKTMSSYVNSVDEVERITGLDFFSALPDNIEKKVEAKADLNEWR